MASPLKPVELLKLVSEAELEQFARLLDCRLTTAEPRDELAGVIENMPRTKVVSALVSVNGVWLAMMRDVVRFLEKCGASLRTTGCVLILPTDAGDARLYLSPQIAVLIARFDAETFRPKTISDWSEALSKLRSSETWLRHVLQDGVPARHSRFSPDKMMDAAIRGRSTRDLYENRIRVDARASERMFSLWRTLEYLNDKLGPFEDLSKLPPAVKKFRDEVELLTSTFTQRISRVRRDSELWRELTRHVKRTEPWSADSSDAEELFQDKCWRHDSHWDRWVRFVEDVLSLAEPGEIAGDRRPVATRLTERSSAPVRSLVHVANPFVVSVVGVHRRVGIPQGRRPSRLESQLLKGLGARRAYRTWR